MPPDPRPHQGCDGEERRSLHGYGKDDRSRSVLASKRTYPALTFTPGLQSYNEVNSWFAEGMAEAGYVVLIIDPQGQGDSENCGHTPDGTQTTCPTTDQPTDTKSAIDFML